MSDQRKPAAIPREIASVHDAIRCLSEGRSFADIEPHLSGVRCDAYCYSLIRGAEIVAESNGHTALFVALTELWAFFDLQTDAEEVAS